MAGSRQQSGGDRHLRLLAPLWFEHPLDAPAQRLAAVEDERTRLLALATGEHALPYELALRVAALTGELAQLAVTG